MTPPILILNASIKLLGRFFVIGLLGLLGGCGTSMVASLPVGAKRDREVRFTPDDWPKPLAADVFYRPGESRRPAILLVHGGSWSSDGAKWTMNSIARKLVRRGYVVVNVTYRGLPADRYPAPVEDLREAIHWMRRNADLYGIDPDRIGTYGFSAGGHLASLVALKGGNPENVKAIVAASAPFDLTLYPAGDIVPRFLGGTQKEIPGKFRDASPVNHVTRSSPPIFITQGTKDDLVQPEHAIRMQAAYRRNGMNPEIRWLEGRSHVTGFIFSGRSVDEAIDFLDGVMKR